MPATPSKGALPAGWAGIPNAPLPQQTQTSPWALIDGELDQYLAQFAQLDSTGSGFIGPEQATKVLESSQLPREALAWIWELSDASGNGQLSFGEFTCAMALVSRHHQGLPLPQTLPPELAEHLGRPISNMKDSHQKDALPPVDAQEYEHYRSLFHKVDSNSTGFVEGEVARQVLESSQLPVNELSLIWQLSDADGDGALELNEFVCAMALASRRQQGWQIPTSFPQGFLS